MKQFGGEKKRIQKRKINYANNFLTKGKIMYLVWKNRTLYIMKYFEKKERFLKIILI